jgi:hypothetical protein
MRTIDPPASVRYDDGIVTSPGTSADAVGIIKRINIRRTEWRYLSLIVISEVLITFLKYKYYAKKYY